MNRDNMNTEQIIQEIKDARWYEDLSVLGERIDGKLCQLPDDDVERIMKFYLSKITCLNNLETETIN